MKNSFVYKGGDLEGGDVYELCVQLPDDGCPDSQQHLVLQVVIRHDEPADVLLDVLTQNKKKSYRVVSAQTGNTEALSRLLYPVARTVVRVNIEPV